MVCNVVHRNRNRNESALIGLDDLFNHFFADFDRAVAWPGSPERRLVPRLEVNETGKAIEVSAELPGLEEKDVEVTLEENVLTIQGEKKAERDEQKEGVRLSERSYGRFSRSVALPEEIDESKVKARFKNGVLYVEIPRTEPVRPERKKISISTEK